MFSARSRRVSTLQRQETMPSVRLQIEVVGNGRRGPQSRREVARTETVAAGKFIKAPGVRLAHMAGEWGAERDDEPHHFRQVLGKLPRKEPTEAPADEAHRAPVLNPELAQRLMRALEHAGPEPEVQPLAPTDCGITTRAQEVAQKRGAGVAHSEAREHYHRMAVAFRRGAPGAAKRDRRTVLPERPDFEQLQRNGRTTWRIGVSGCPVLFPN
jgi:hypothetical protein